MTQFSNAARSMVWFTAMGIACGGQRRPDNPAPHSAPPDSSPASVPATAKADTNVNRWLSVDSAGRTVSLDLKVTAGGKAGLINGFHNGEARIIVPLGWTVRWNWRNEDPGTAHSLVAMVQREKIPLEGGRAAFSNAMSRLVTEGLPPGQTDQTTFVADEAGWFWILCGVPGHALEGEWIEMRVDPEAKTGSVRTRT